jgi:hypothetical protein
MNKLLIAIVALVTVFSLPASAVTVFSGPSAALIGRGPAPRFRDIPDVSRNMEANNPEHRQLPSTEQASQSWTVTGQITDPARSETH